ncbi:MAG: hypothetical protein JWL80_273 [Parcubacteria group bacterium]|nr:hypothetical protein [Parcubacteria group bacterium]
MNTQATVSEEYTLDNGRAVRTRIMETRRDDLLAKLKAEGLCEVYKRVHLNSIPLAKVARELEMPFADVVAKDNQIREILRRDLESQPPVQ